MLAFLVYRGLAPARNRLLTNAMFVERALSLMSLVVMLANVASDLQPHRALITSTLAHLDSYQARRNEILCGTRMA
jgi:hypothetical protein